VKHRRLAERLSGSVGPIIRGTTVEIVEPTAITHNDSASIAACVAFVSILWELLGRTAAPEPQWWVDSYVRVARELEHREDYRPRGGDFPGYQGSLWRFVEEKVPAAYERGLSTLDACESWYSGAYLLETVPCVFYILMCHGDDAETAMVRPSTTPGTTTRSQPSSAQRSGPSMAVRLCLIVG